MKAFFDNFHFVAALFSILPALLGLFYLKRLNKLIIALLLVKVISVILIILSNFNIFSPFVNTTYLFYFGSISAVVTYTIFFYFLFVWYNFKKYFFIFPILFFLIFIFGILNEAEKYLEMLPYIFIDIFIIILSFFYFYKHKKVSRYLYILLISLISYSIFDILFSLFSEFLYQYQSNKLFMTLWYGISPIANIAYAISISYVFYLAARSAKPKFDSHPDFR